MKYFFFLFVLLLVVSPLVAEKTASILPSLSESLIIESGSPLPLAGEFMSLELQYFRATRTRNIGIFLTVGGAVTTIIGSFFLFNEDKELSTSYELGYYLMYSLGGIALISGTITWITGSVRRSRLDNAMSLGAIYQ